MWLQKLLYPDSFSLQKRQPVTDEVILLSIVVKPKPVELAIYRILNIVSCMFMLSLRVLDPYS